MPVGQELRKQVDTAIMSRGAVTSRNMMGTTAFFVGRRMFAFWVADGLVTRLPDRARQDFLDRRAGVLFQGPQGRGSGDWTRLNLAKEADVDAVLDGVKAAFEHLTGARPKALARKKGRKR